MRTPLFAGALLLLHSSLQAATINCTIDGTGAAPRVAYGSASDCKVSGSGGSYLLTAKKEPKFVQVSCWRDGPGGDVARCMAAVARNLANRKEFYVGTFQEPGSSGVRSAWFSVTFIN
ncbi:hypothetical protein [Tahibacter caeni]|uniref:hypothetical protein n=1 Tax=Tahibacter caeni TaxID=1453545 RepID=UPI002147838F|nr:hypothetical protein [Tahibacter caeni]